LSFDRVQKSHFSSSSILSDARQAALKITPQVSAGLLLAAAGWRC